MKRGKGKKSNKSKKNTLARYRSKWELGKKGKPECKIVPKAEDNTPPAAVQKVIDGVRKQNAAIASGNVVPITFANVERVNAERKEQGIKPIASTTAAGRRAAVMSFIADEVLTYQGWSEKAHERVDRTTMEIAYQQKLRNKAEGKVRARAMYSILKKKLDERVEQEAKPVFDMPKPRLVPPYTATSPQNVAFNMWRASQERTALTVDWGKSVHSKQVTDSNIDANAGWDSPATKVTDSNRTDTGLLKYPGSTAANAEWYESNMPENEGAKPDLYKDYEELSFDLSKAIIHNAELVEQLNDNDIEITRLNAEIEKLKEDKAILNEEIYYAHWELGVVKGEEIEPINLENLKTVYARALSKPTPKTLANLYNVFKVQYRDNSLHAFCSILGVPIEEERKVQAQLDFRKQQLNNVELERAWCKTMSEKQPAKVRFKTQNMQAERAWRVYKREVLTDKKAVMSREFVHHSPVLEIFRERKFYTRLSRRNPSKWLGKLEHRQYLHDALSEYNVMAGKRKRFAAMQERVRNREADRALMNTTSYKVLKSVKDFLTNEHELNPVTRYRNKKAAIAQAEFENKQLTKASRIKDMREQKTEQELIREKIREAQRIAH